MIGSVSIKSRPLKFAFLVDPDSADQARRAINIASSVWGGAYSPIIPLYKRMPRSWRDGPFRAPLARKVVTGYVDAFDPDLLVQLSNEVPKCVSDLGLEIIKPSQIWQSDYKNGSPVIQYGISFTEVLARIYKDHFRFKAKYPMKVVFPSIPNRYSLFFASVFGSLDEERNALLDPQWRDALEVETKDVTSGSFVDLLHSANLFPRRVTQYGIRTLRHSHRRKNGVVFFMDAARWEDVVDYWNLRATGESVIPLPRQYLSNAKLRNYVIDFLKERRRNWAHQPTVCDMAHFIRARGCTEEEMHTYTKSLEIERPKDDPSADGFFALQHWFPRIWDEWARSKDGAVPDDIYANDEEVRIEVDETESGKLRFPSVLPEFARKSPFTGGVRCSNEVVFNFYGSREYLAEVFPKSTGRHFVRSISGLTSYRDWRVGRNGLIKLIKYDFSEVTNIPSAEKVFFAWLEDLGWVPKLSPPGILAKQIYKQSDGYPSIFANEKLLGLIEHMNGGSVRQDGSPSARPVLQQDRDVEVGEVKNRIKDDSGHGRLHDSLISMGVFKLGLRVQCPNCFRHSWYPLNQIRDSLSCSLCLSAFPSIGNLVSPKWCYKTAGPFSVGRYAEGAYAVLLTLQMFENRRMTATRITPVLSFVAESSDKRIEADFALFWEQQLIGERTTGLMFGECKTYGEFEKKDFERMRYLAKTFPGAILVFSTLRKGLSATEVKAISRIAKAGRKRWKEDHSVNPVLVLTGNELLQRSPLPYCWDENTKKRFENLHGLVNVCDATQQLYLGLPSIQSELREQWERRRRAVSKVKVSEQPSD